MKKAWHSGTRVISTAATSRVAQSLPVQVPGTLCTLVLLVETARSLLGRKADTSTGDLDNMIKQIAFFHLFTFA